MGAQQALDQVYHAHDAINVLTKTKYAGQASQLVRTAPFKLVGLDVDVHMGCQEAAIKIRTNSEQIAQLQDLISSKKQGLSNLTRAIKTEISSLEKKIDEAEKQRQHAEQEHFISLYQ